MIAVPWFKSPWTFATGDAAHALVQRAIDGDVDAKAEIEEIKAQADGGNKLAVEAWRYFSAIIRLVVAGQPPPSVLLQMKGVQVGGGGGGGHHHGGGGGFGYPGGVPMGPWGFEPWGYPMGYEDIEFNVGHHHGGHHGGGGWGYGWGGPWGYGFDPFVIEEVEYVVEDVPESKKGGSK